MTEVIMPKMGDGMEEGTLVEWLKNEGDTVKSGETIANIQTDKATLEMEAPATGTLAGIILQAGQTVPVGTPIAAVLAKGEDLPGGWGSTGSAQPASGRPKDSADKPTERKTEAVAAVTSVSEGASNGGRVKASPLARKIAMDAGVDLGSLVGSGPGGRIVEKDVRDALAASPAKAALRPIVAATDTKVPLTPLRRITAERTQQSKRDAPHFYVTVEVDVERVMALREFFKEEESGPVSVNDFIIVASARALREMPEVNATFGGDHVLLKGAVNIGIAVAVEDGLTVAVLHGADRLTLRQVSGASRDLASRARDNKLSLDELGGSTFSISNMGMLGVENFSAIINGPNAAILAVSTAGRKAVATDEETIEVRWRMNMTGSFDHRVVDGATGAKFMNVVRRLLENPTHLLS